MDELRWSARPKTSRPVLVAAFEGWNDAGDAATTAVDHLVEHWQATPFADIDPEGFFDFTATRPKVAGDHGARTVVWPANTFFARRGLVDGVDVVFLRGTEPQLRWRTFCGLVLEVAERTDARLVLTAGALLADVPHSRPTPLYGNTDDPMLAEALRLEPSRYEGPTGIVGVLHDECSRRNLSSASLWAAVPAYVAATRSPKAALALVTEIAMVLGVDPPLDLEAEVAEYESGIDVLVADDPETAAYVAELERSHDDESVTGDSVEAMLSAVERYLREH
ncbi:MAG: PAC2 family protein [Microthrixaceae bacterium]